MQPTALVLGAGASATFGLPLGTGLRDQIATDLNIKFDGRKREQTSGNYEITEALRHLNRDEHGRSGNINPHRLAAVEIANAMPLSSSIDEYIERHRQDEKKAICAKIAIVWAIIGAERKSSIFVDPRDDVDNPLAGASECWLAAFLRDLTRGHSARNVHKAFENISIVNFNYDRCLEHFLFLWLQEVYRLSEDEAANLVGSIYIYHPYGQIAPLRWQDPRDGISYGAAIRSSQLVSMASGIRTYSEAFEPDSGLFDLKARMADVSSVVFMGFGFHQQNMKLISVDRGDRQRSLKCFATKSDISAPRWEIMKQRVAEAFDVPPQRDVRDFSFDGYCESFWKEYSDVILE